MTLKKAYLIILLSFVWLIGGAMLFSLIAPEGEGTLADVLGWTLLLGFAAIFLAGTAIWAGGKGYHPLVGVALGWVGPLGLLVLVFLPDKSQS